MDPGLRGAVNRIEKSGFAKVQGLVPLWLTRALTEGSDELFGRQSKDWNEAYEFYESMTWQPTAFASPGKASTFMDFLGESPKLDDAVDALLSIPAITGLLDEVMGPNHRIWFASIRRSEPHCQGIPMHQDIPGEFGLCLLLSDSDESDGQIAFIPGSHRWPRVIDRGGISVDLQNVSAYMERGTGEAGDIYFFLNKTWHARTHGGERAATVLILTFIPEQAGEWGRRLPAHTRERLGSRIQELTRETAGRLRAGSSYDDFGFPTGTARPLAIQAEDPSIGLLSPWRFFRFLNWGRNTAASLSRIRARLSAR